MSLRVAAARGAFWSLAEKAAEGFSSLVVFLILVRMLGPEAFGLVALALVFIALTKVFAEQGIGAAIIQRPVLEELHTSTAFWASLASGLVLTGIGVLGAEVIAGLLGEPAVAPVVRWLSLTFTLVALSQIQESLLRRDLAFRALAVRAVIARFVGGGVGIGMALAGFGVWSLVGMNLAQAITGIVVLWSAGRWRPTLAFSWQHYVELLRFGVHIAGVNLLTFVNRRSDNLIIGVFLGPVALGYYTVAYKVLEMGSSVVTGAISKVALPVFSRLQLERERLHAAFHRVTTLGAFVGFPIFATIATLAPRLVPVAFGERWLPSVPVLQILCLVGMLHGLAFFNGTVLTAVGKPRWTLVINLISAVANVVGFLIGVRWGIQGVAWAYAIRTYALYPVTLVILHRQVGIGMSEYFAPLPRTLVATALSVLAMVGIAFALDPVASAWVVLCVQAATGVAVYLLCAWRIDPAFMREMFDLLRRMRSTRATTPGAAIAP